MNAGISAKSTAPSSLVSACARKLTYCRSAMKVGISEKFTTPSWLQSPNRNGATNVTVTVASGLKKSSLSILIALRSKLNGSQSANTPESVTSRSVIVNG